jgi:hypothetical protein
MLASLMIRSRHDHHPPIHAPIPRKHLAAWRVVSSGTEMQVHPATLHLHLVDLSFAVLLAACLEREHLCVSR